MNYIDSRKRIKTLFLIIFVILLVVLIIVFKPQNKLKDIVTYKLLHPRGVTLYPTTNNNLTKTTSTKKYIYPVNGVVTSEYGYRSYPYSGFHTGIDISCYTHRDNVLAIADGVVTFAGSQNGYGNCIEIKHEFENETIYSFYAHLFSINVYEGKKVLQGDIIGNEGGDPYTDPNPGNSTGHHLHFELRKASGYGNDINPYLGV